MTRCSVVLLLLLFSLAPIDSYITSMRNPARLFFPLERSADPNRSWSEDEAKEALRQLKVVLEEQKRIEEEQRKLAASGGWLERLAALATATRQRLSQQQFPHHRVEIPLPRRQEAPMGAQQRECRVTQ